MLKKALTSSFAASFAVSGALAQGQQPPPLSIVLASDQDVTLAAELNAQDITNSFLILCPTHPSYDLFINDGGAIAILRYQDRETMESTLPHIETAIAYDRTYGTQMPSTQSSQGMIDDLNQVLPAYKLEDLLKLRQEFLAQEELPYGDTQSEDLIQAIRAHAMNFCFNIG